MERYRYCAQCGKGFPILTFVDYAYKLVCKDNTVRWFCCYTCMLRYKRENPDIVRAEKRGRKKKSKGE